jgi:hypothetical protein
MGIGMRGFAAIVLVLGVLSAGCAAAGPAALQDEAVPTESVSAIHGVFRPYIWVPAFDGSIALDGTRAEAKGNPWSIGYGAGVDVNEDRWAFVADASQVFIDGGLDPAPFSPGPSFEEEEQRFTIVEASAGPCILGRRGEKLRADVLVGFRLERHWLEFRSDDGDKKTVDDKTWIDPTIGARLLWRPSEKFSLQVRGDAGLPAMSGPTWEFFAGIAVGNPAEAHVAFGFRALRVNFERGNDDFGISTHLAGAWIGLEVPF